MKINGCNNIDYFKVGNVTDVAYASELCGKTLDQGLSSLNSFSSVDSDLSVLVQLTMCFERLQLPEK